MRQQGLLRAFSYGRAATLLRRPHGVPAAGAPDVVALHHCCTPWRVATQQRCVTSGEEFFTPSKSDDRAWTDGMVVEGIRRVLSSLPPPSQEGQQSVENNAHSIHALFRALGPSLRYRLQNSSYGSLNKALKSRPDWFLLDDNGSRVSLSKAAWSLDNTCRRGNGDVAASGTASSDARSPKGAITASTRCVLVRGALISTPVDVSKPLLTPEEIEKWKLTRLILPLGLPFYWDREPATLFPYGEKPRQLTPELADVEAMYSSKGFFTPSDVAAAFIPITPTFFVETRHVLNAMSPGVAQCFERCIPKERVVDVFLKKYPMIFKLKLGKFQKAAVKLNLDFPFIREYPGCGRADRLLRRWNQEYRATVGGVLPRQLASSSSSSHTLSSSSLNDAGAQGRRAEPHIDMKIFETLVRHLPRVATEPTLSKEELEEKRCRPFPLVEWIDGFSQEDLDVLNSVPQQRVLTLLTRYTRIFQLMCHGEDSNVFSEHTYLEALRDTKRKQRPCMDGGNGDDSPPPTLNVSSEIPGNVDGGNSSPVERETKVVALNATAEPESNLKRREANIAAALRDDMLGLDDFINDTSNSAVLVETSTLEANKDANTEFNTKEDEEQEEADLTEVKEENEEEEDSFAFNSDEGDNNNNNSGERGRLGSGSGETDPRVTEQASTDDDWSGPYIPSRYDIIYVRRLPKHIAPRSLSDYNTTNSPEPELLRQIASFLNPPPSLRESSRTCTPQVIRLERVARFPSAANSGPWRWVPIQRIYASLSKAQKRLLRPYKGLVHFMRLHGEIFELSADFLYVIAHDPQGQIPPFVPTQVTFYSEDRVLLPPTIDDDENSRAALIGDAERNKFEGILGASQIPTNRQQLLLLDPLNPLLDHDVLCEEVSFFMPDHPVSLPQLMGRLPPILRAALSTRHKNNFKTSKHLTVWTENNRMMLQKSQLAIPESASMGEESLTVEDAIECVREVVPDEGVMVGHLQRMLPFAAKKALKEHFGNVYNALLGYPQYFYVEKVEGSHYNSMLFLVERLQEEKQ